MRLVRKLHLILFSTVLIAACVRNTDFPSCDPGLRRLGDVAPLELPHSSKKYRGRVDLVFEVTGDGKVVNPRISFSNIHFQGEDALPQGEYEEVLLASVRAWRFQPPPMACVMQSGAWFD